MHVLFVLINHISNNLIFGPAHDVVILPAFFQIHFRTKIPQRLTTSRAGIPHCKGLLDALTVSLNQYKARQTPAAVLLIDVDYFKSINDRFGHIEGDKVLRGLTQHTITHLREGDLFARFGGEEFALLLPNTSLAAAELIADRLRLSIAEGTFLSSGNLKVTVSIGLSTIQPQDQDIESVLHRADDALYTAKRNGRNCSISAA